MKKVVLAVLAMALVAPAAMAQDNRDHFELGAFADYFRLNPGHTGLWGVGGRVGFGVAPHVNVEADMAYDFERNITQTSTGNNTGVNVNFGQVNTRLWHGLFGPMVWVGSKRARLFGEVKGGFLNFSISNASPTSGFTNNTSNFFTDSTKGAFAPGGGAEVSVGPVGIRVDISDFMYFNNGAVHNLSIKAGPTLHF